MTAILFLAFLVVVTVAAVAAAATYLPRRATARISVGLLLWLIYVGLLAYFGVVRNTAIRPPGIVFIVLPVMLFILLFLAGSGAGARVAAAFPLWILLGLQTFRVGVELLLHRLWIDGLAPRMLTYEGGNVDIFIGLSAPLIAWASTRGIIGGRLALVWSVIGLMSLANIVTRAMLTVPGPFHLIRAELPNVALGTFPYTYIAGFFAPLAIALHFLAIRALRAKHSIHSGVDSARDVRSDAR